MKRHQECDSLEAQVRRELGGFDYWLRLALCKIGIHTRRYDYHCSHCGASWTEVWK